MGILYPLEPHSRRNNHRFVHYNEQKNMSLGMKGNIIFEIRNYYY